MDIFGLLILILLCILAESSMRMAHYNTTGHLWCHVGGKGRWEFGPQQCELGVEQCFKFICEGGQHDFVVRACGVSMLTKGTGLPNESCWQAQSVCQYLGGTSQCYPCDHKHMCNSNTRHNLVFATIISFFIILFLQRF